MRRSNQAKAVRRDNIARVDSGPRPVWMSVLLASRSQAVSSGRGHDVSWEWIAGRAVYTNAGPGTELIQPLGIGLRSGHTLAIHWAPDETGYTINIYRQRSLCVA